MSQYHALRHGGNISAAMFYQDLHGGNAAPSRHSPANGRIRRLLADTLVEGKWLIAFGGFLALLAALLYTGMDRPLYEADMLLQIRSDGGRNGNLQSGEARPPGDAGASSDHAAELLQSRLVVSRALDKIGQYTLAEPKRLPLLGAWLGQGGIRLQLPPWMGAYAWGAESIEVGKFRVPESLLDREFLLSSEGNGQFRLRDERGLVAGAGRVGMPLRLDSGPGPVELHVVSMDARAGVQFRLVQQSRSAAIRDVQARLQLHHSAKHPGLLKVVLRGNDRERIGAVLAEIGNAYIAETSAASLQRIDPERRYMDRRLDETRKHLLEAESRYDSFLATKGAADLAEELKSLLQQLAAAKARKSEFVLRRDELLVRFTPNHPVLLGQEAQLRALNAEIASLSAQIKTMPAAQQGALRLAREVDSNVALYRSLQDSARQLDFISNTAPDPVRVIDAPLVGDAPAMANREEIVGWSVLAGLLLGLAAAMMKRGLRTAVSAPEELELSSRLPVCASICHSKAQRKRQTRDLSGAAGLALLARDAPQDEAMETLRRFRAALLYASPRAKNNIVLFTSPEAQTGKSFIAANLAVLLGAGNLRILLVDGDLRQGDLHRYFQAAPGSGLSDVLADPRNMPGVVQCQVAPNVDLISCGSGMPQASDLLLRPGLQSLLADLSPRYDLILVNGTPVLEASDSLTIGQHAGAIYLVIRANESTARGIEETVRILERSGLNATGCLLNAVSRSPQRSVRKYHYGRAWPVRYVLANPMKTGTALPSASRKQAR